MPADQKIKREIDKAYLAYIREQPCLVWNCPNKASVHHDPSIGAGGSDYESLPLCNPLHHIEGVHRIGKDTFQEKFNLNFDRERIRLLKGYIKKLKAEKKP